MSTPTSTTMQTATAAASTATNFIASSLGGLLRKGEEKKGSDLDRMYRAKIRPLIDAVDQLRGILTNESNIKLPSIVVVGDQSSGKSSVLEALSGVALPRGQNITTRCPLVLRLVNLTAHNDDTPETTTIVPAPYAIIGTHSKNEEKITDLDQVGKKIEEFTARLAGRGVAVVSTPIMLSVYRANSPDLTLVDLPGITRNPIGDQPKDIYRQIQEMIQQFIIPEESVILNVMPATVDFPTCECMMMAKQVDPNGERTIAVVTKMDLAEKGIRKKLEYGVSSLNLRLGLVAVRNRTQAENEAGVTFEQARINEMNFFKNHPELAGVDGLLGTQRLAELLTSIQEQRIRATLPKVRINIIEQLEMNRSQLAEMPTALRTPTDARIRYDQMLNAFVQSVSQLVRGDHAPALGSEKLHVSARLHEQYLTFQKTCYELQPQFLTTEYAKIVEEEMKESAGLMLPNIISPQVFQALIRREIKKLRVPSKTLITSARTLIATVLSSLATQQFLAFPNLATRLQQEISSYIENCQRTVISRVEELLAQEEQEIFSINSYYLDTVGKIKVALNRLTEEQKGNNSNQPPMAIKKMGNLTQFQVNDFTVGVDLQAITRIPTITVDHQINTLAYTQVCLKRVCDALPLIIKYHFVRAITQPGMEGLLSKLQSTPFATDSGGDKLLELMREQADQHVKREKLITSITRLEEALRVFEKL